MGLHKTTISPFHKGKIMAKRKRRRRISGLPAIIVLLLLLVIGGSTWGFFYLNGNKLNLPGERYREIDVTAQVKQSAREYLNTAAFGDEIDIDQYFENLVIESKLTVTKEGQFTEKVSEEKHYEISEQARKGLEQAISDLITMRIKNNYIETSMTTEQLMQETFGMSLSEYLKQYGPELVPSYSKLNSEYGRNWSYVANRDVIMFDGETEENGTGYAVTHGMLVIDYKEGAVVYHDR